MRMSHKGEKLDCEILEVAGRLIKDTGQNARTHGSKNATHGTTQWLSVLLGHIS